MARILRWERALTALALLALTGLAVERRLAQLATMAVDPDWTWFLRVGSQVGHGQAWVGPAMFMYPTFPCLLFGLMARLCGDGPTTILAWTLLGSLAAPLTLLAVRAIAGLPAGVVAGLVVALSATQIWVSTGLKSPYIVGLATALLALGLAGATARRPAGLLLGAAGAALMSTLHIGLLPATALALVLLLLHLPRLPGAGARLLGLGGLLLGAGPIAGWSLYVDRARLLRDLSVHAAEPWRSSVDHAELLRRLETGVSLRLSTAEDLLPLAALGLLLALLLQLLLRRREEALDRRVRAERALVALQCGLLTAAGLGPYLYQLDALHYFEAHHAVAVVPLGLAALAGAASAWTPRRLRPLGLLLGALLLLPWLRDALEVPWPRPPQPNRLLDWSVQRALAERIRAEAGQAQPVVVGWFSDELRVDPVTPVRVLSELVRVGPYLEGREPTCFLWTDAAAREELGALPQLLDLGEGGILLTDPGCAALPDLGETLCAEREDRRRGLRHDYGGPVAEQRLLPACYGRPRR